MESIKLRAKNSKQISPAVDFNIETGVCILEGDSYLESPRPFYEPLINWLEKFSKEQSTPITMEFKVKYFNTSTSGFFLDMLLLLKEHENSGGDVVVNWYIDEPDSDLEEEIEDYQMDTDITINVIKEY